MGPAGPTSQVWVTSNCLRSLIGRLRLHSSTMGLEWPTRCPYDIPLPTPLALPTAEEHSRLGQQPDRCRASVLCQRQENSKLRFISTSKRKEENLFRLCKGRYRHAQATQVLFLPQAPLWQQCPSRKILPHMLKERFPNLGDHCGFPTSRTELFSTQEETYPQWERRPRGNSVGSEHSFEFD